MFLKQHQSQKGLFFPTQKSLSNNEETIFYVHCGLYRDMQDKIVFTLLCVDTTSPTSKYYEGKEVAEFKSGIIHIIFSDENDVKFYRYLMEKTYEKLTNHYDFKDNPDRFIPVEFKDDGISQYYFWGKLPIKTNTISFQSMNLDDSNLPEGVTIDSALSLYMSQHLSGIGIGLCENYSIENGAKIESKHLKMKQLEKIDIGLKNSGDEGKKYPTLEEKVEKRVNLLLSIVSPKDTDTLNKTLSEKFYSLVEKTNKFNQSQIEVLKLVIGD